jgi:hypothetical protein
MLVCCFQLQQETANFNPELLNPDAYIIIYARQREGYLGKMLGTLINSTIC